VVARCLDRQRTRHHISPDHDPVDAHALHLGEHRLERRHVGVEVIERGNAQRGGMLASHRVRRHRAAVDDLRPPATCAPGHEPQ
jgi:hypothetical protein